MASIVTTHSPELVPERSSAGSTLSPSSAQEALSSAATNTVPARLQVRMGRAVTVGEGINWLTLTVLIVFISARLPRSSSSPGNG